MLVGHVGMSQTVWVLWDHAIFEFLLSVPNYYKVKMTVFGLKLLLPYCKNVQECLTIDPWHPSKKHCQWTIVCITKGLNTNTLNETTGKSNGKCGLQT